MSTSAVSQSGVQVRRTFVAPVEKVFQAWTDPRMVIQWFGLKPSWRNVTKMLAYDARPGGSYRFEITSPEGRVNLLSGTFREVTPPQRLVFTWRFENQPQFPESLVTVEFRKMGTSNFTEVILNHTLLPEESREEYRAGWNGCLDALEKIFG